MLSSNKLLYTSTPHLTSLCLCLNFGLISLTRIGERTPTSLVVVMTRHFLSFVCLSVCNIMCHFVYFLICINFVVREGMFSFLIVSPQNSWIALLMLIWLFNLLKFDRIIQSEDATIGIFDIYCFRRLIYCRF